MSEHIILKQDPRIEFRFQESGFDLVDSLEIQHTGAYRYAELDSAELTRPWFLFCQVAACHHVNSEWAPIFPAPETCKRAKRIIRSERSTLGIYLTYPSMAIEARRIKEYLDTALAGSSKN